MNLIKWNYQIPVKTGSLSWYKWWKQLNHNGFFIKTTNRIQKAPYYTHKNNYLIQWILLNLGIIQQHSLCPWQTIVNYRPGKFLDPFVLSKNNFYMTPIKTYRIEVSNNKY